MNFVKAPVALLRLSTISDSARLLWCILMSYADPDGTNCFPGTAKLSKDMGKDRKAIFRHLAELEGAGLIERATGRKAGEFSTNSYRVLKPSPRPQNGTLPRPQNGDTTKSHVPKRRIWDGLGGVEYDGRRNLMQSPD